MVSPRCCNPLLGQLHGGATFAAGEVVKDVDPNDAKSHWVGQTTSASKIRESWPEPARILTRILPVAVGIIDVGVTSRADIHAARRAPEISV